MRTGCERTRVLDYFYDVPLPNSHSATIQILKTGRALAELGWTFTFHMRGRPPDAARTLAQIGVEPHDRLHLRQGFPGRPLTPGLRRLALAALPPAALSRTPGIVITRGESGMLLEPALRGSRKRPLFLYEMHRLAFVGEAERRLGRPLLPGETLTPPAERLRRREARTVAAADGLIFLTVELQAATSAAFPGLAPSIVAPSGVDPGSSCNRAKDVDIVYIGKIERRKGVDLALDAMRHLPGRRLRLVGDGAHLAWAQARARDSGIGDRVEFVGRLPHAAVEAELAKAKIGLCPLPANVDQVSTRFTSPLKLLEMMAAGLPIVATDLPSVRAICTAGEHALLAPADDARALAAAVEQLLNTPALAARLGAAARRRAADFTWAARAGRIAFLIDRLADTVHR